MDTIYSQSNWKLVIRRESDHIVILRAQTCDVRAVLPDTLYDLPVTVLGDHALAPNASAVAGEEVRLTCGPEGEWDNRNLQELTLPAFLTDVHNYALYGCRGLHTLHLHDRVDRWGGCCLMNCRALHTFYLTRVGEKQGEALSLLCEEIHDELDVTVYQTDGTVLRLIFPDYAEEYEENCPNHHFDYKISGGGYPYHHLFRSKQLILPVYDSLWEKYLKGKYEPETALRLAYTRLMWPVELSEQAKNQYHAFLCRQPEQALLWQLTQKDAAGLRLMLEILQPNDALLHLACGQARVNGDTESLALLLERQHKAAPRGLDKDFDL